MKQKLLTIFLAITLVFMCVAFSSCGSMAALAGGNDTDYSSEDSADAEETYKVIFNSNPGRMRYHLEGCRGVDQISEEHYQEYELTIEEIKEKQDKEGWIPCGWCDPDVKLGIDSDD